jgi:hypothetical protein
MVFMPKMLLVWSYFGKNRNTTLFFQNKIAIFSAENCAHNIDPRFDGIDGGINHQSHRALETVLKAISNSELATRELDKNDCKLRTGKNGDFETCNSRA